MLTTLRLERYRRFRALTVAGLGRVNLIFGPNDAGKTSLLEAVEMLAAAGVPQMLWRVPARRGERVLIEVRGKLHGTSELDVRHLFHGHRLSVGSRFVIEGDEAGAGARRVECGGVAAPPPLPRAAAAAATPSAKRRTLTPPPVGGMAVELRTSRGAAPTRVELSLHGGLVFDDGREVKAVEAGAVPASFLGADGLESYRLGALWDQAVLAPEEGFIRDMLQLVEPKVERVVFVTREGSRVGEGAVYLERTKAPGAVAVDRVPLGSLGEGARRLLLVAIQLARSARGYLLADEIDTALDANVLVGMWRAVIEAARRLDIQVFATTQSQDCVRALASVHDRAPTLAGDIALFRVDRGSERVAPLGEEDVRAAAQKHAERRA
jgi:hypothetical protein